MAARHSRERRDSIALKISIQVVKSLGYFAVNDGFGQPALECSPEPRAPAGCEACLLVVKITDPSLNEPDAASCRGACPAKMSETRGSALSQERVRVRRRAFRG